VRTMIRASGLAVDWVLGGTDAADDRKWQKPLVSRLYAFAANRAACACPSVSRAAGRALTGLLTFPWKSAERLRPVVGSR
jgi:hypothetical protein